MHNFSKRRKIIGYKPLFRNILVCSKKELAPFITVFSYHPENVEQEQLGTLFGIIKIDDTSEDSSYVTNLLTSVIKKEYFSKSHRSAEESFEASLKKANLALAELVRHGSTSWAGKINFSGGSVEKNNLHFSCLGNVSIFLIRHGQIVEISKDLEEGKDSETHPLKTFSNISSGKLEMGDKLIFTTHELTDIFSSEELRQNSEHFSREEFPGFLEISLGANSEFAGTIIIDVISAKTQDAVTISSPVIGQEKIKRIDSFVGSQENPLEYAPLREKINYPEILHEAEIEPQEAKAKKPLLRKISVFFGNLSRSAEGAMKKSTNYLGELKTKIPSKKKVPQVSEKQSKSSKLPAVWGKIKSFFLTFSKRMKNIDYKNRNLLAGLGISLALIIIVSLIFLAIRSKNNRNNAAQNSSPIQKVEAPAVEPTDINVKNVESLEVVTDITQAIGSLAILDGVLYSPSGKSILKINPQSKNVEEIASNNLSTGSFKLIAAMPNLGNLFMLTEDNRIVSLTPTNKNFLENTITLADNLKATDIKTYLTYLYFLDPSANQIYRYPRAEGGFGERSDWLQAGTDIKNAQNFAINDDVFISGVGGIMPLLQGKADSSISFEKPNISLLIDKIYSEPGFTGIYALDNQNHRIVQYDKQGKITAQYFNESIRGVKDFVVDEKNKAVYLLVGNQLEKFSLE
jgi:hypothetical protein